MLHDLSLTQLDAAAADLMCASTEADNTAYDGTTRSRGIYAVFAQWGAFRQFVEEAHKDRRSEV